jgi:aminoglycoside 3-N-acetyltransferase
MAPYPEDLLNDPGFSPATRSGLRDGMVELGVRPSGVLMVHTRMSAFGWIAGGAETVVRACIDAVGPDGTVLAFVGWEDSPFHLRAWPDKWRQAYEAEMPPFDPAVSEARYDFGRVPERLRTWPGAVRSSHPEVSFAAVGPRARWLVGDEALDDPWGPQSVLGRLVASQGQVVGLGAPLGALTLCHHAERIASVAGKRMRRYSMPVLTPEGASEWREFESIDAFLHVLDYEDVGVHEHPIEHLARVALAAGAGRTGRILRADCWLFESAPALEHVVGWLETSFPPDV